MDTSTSNETSTNGSSVHPAADAREGLAALVDLAADLDALLQDHGDRLPLSLVHALRFDLARAGQQLQQHRRRLTLAAARQR